MYSFAAMIKKKVTLRDAFHSNLMKFMNETLKSIKLIKYNAYKVTSLIQYRHAMKFMIFQKFSDL